MAPAGFFKRSNQNKASKSDEKNDEQDIHNRRRAWILCCKKATKFTFSHLGLCVITGLYAIAGTFMFMHVEQTNEKQLCIQAMNVYIPMENATANKLWEISTTFRSSDDEDLAMAAIQKQIQQFGQNVIALNYDGSNCTLMGETGGPDYKWNLPGSLLFSITVFTTIGYGNITPKTTWGRLVCIAYAVVGIPLMLLCLANLGEIMAEIFRFVYSRVCCCGCCRGRGKTRGLNDSAQNLKGSDENASSPEAWKNRYEVQTSAESETVDDDDEDEYEKVSVPLTVTMAVIAGYIAMGSLLFGVWEEWEWLTSAYYCFITISTIGFGDVVPGTTGFQTSSDSWKMVAASGYIVFGMAIMSMAFNLIQEEIVAKFVWLGQKLGLTEKPKYDEEYDNKGSMQSSSTDAATEQPAPKMIPSSGRPISSYNSPTNVGQLGSPFATTATTMFSAPTKQPAVYQGSGPVDGSNCLAVPGQEPPMIKRTATSSATYKKQ